MGQRRLTLPGKWRFKISFGSSPNGRGNKGSDREGGACGPSQEGAARRSSKIRSTASRRAKWSLEQVLWAVNFRLAVQKLWKRACAQKGMSQRAVMEVMIGVPLVGEFVEALVFNLPAAASVLDGDPSTRSQCFGKGGSPPPVGDIFLTCPHQRFQIGPLR